MPLKKVETTEKTSDTITVKVDGIDRDIFMSFGLLNELTKMFRDIEVVASVHLNPELREEVLKTVLSERSNTGKITAALENIDDVEVSVDDMERLVDWAMEHVIDFFLRSMRKLAALSTKRDTEVAALVSSLDGLKNSPFAKLSSGQPAPDPAS